MTLPDILSRFSRRTRRALAWSAALVLLYALVGFVILPWIVRAVATKQLSKELDRAVTMEQVRINPFALAGAIRGFRIQDPDGQTLLGWDEAYANFELASFFGEPWVFSQLSVSNPVVRVQINKDRSFNFTDLIEKFSKAGPAPGPSKPAALRVDQFHIVGARLALADLTPRQPFRRVVGPVEIALTGFRTDPTSHNPYKFTGSTDSGEVFAWSGNFSINPLRAEGTLSVANVALNKFAPLYEDQVRFAIHDGVASFGASYQFAKSETTNIVTVTNAFLNLRAFKLGEAGSTENLVEVPELAVSGVSGDLLTRAADVASVAVRGAVLNVHRARDESLNFVELAKPAATATNAPGSILFLMRAATNAFALLLNTTNALTGVVRAVDVTDCAVTLHDDVPSRPMRLTLDQIAVTARNLSNRPGTNLTASLSLRWNTNGTARTDLAATIFPLSADVRLALEQVELNPLNPYLENFVNLFVLGSKLGLDGLIKIRTDTNQLPVVTFQGNSRLDDFSTVDGVLAEDLLKWGSLRFEGIEANLNPPAVAIARVKLADGFARFAVETNRTINVLAALQPARTNAAAAVAPVASGLPPAAGTKATARQAFLQVKKFLGERTNAAAATGLPSISVASIEITNTRVQFADRSIAPAVQLALQQLHGTIADLSSDELRHAHIQLSGRVDNTGPVEITGHFNPLHQQQTSELKVVVRDVELNPADPYVGKFLGYRLAKGKVNVDVSYQLSARQLKGKNLIVLDQFTLGEKVTSPDATKLPVRLGLALLKDRAGKIELDVPVEGNLDDPEFKLSRVVWHVILNVFTKAVTSPFALLGSIFGGAKSEEIQFQEFAAGSAEPDASKQSKLDVLLRALEERPGLQLEIEGSYDPVADAAALRRHKLEKRFRTEKWTELRKSEQAQVAPDRLPFTAEEFDAALRRSYDTLLAGQAAAPPPTIPAPRDTSSAPKTAAGNSPKPIGARASTAASTEKGATRLATETRAALPVAPVSEMEQAVLATVVLTDDELRQLAQDRAVRIQQTLLASGKLAADRVFLMEVSPAGTNRASRVFFYLR